VRKVLLANVAAGEISEGDEAIQELEKFEPEVWKNWFG
jgi:hypothetical protein